MNTVTQVLSDPNLFRYKEFCFHSMLHTKEHIETLQDFKIKHDDVFLVTYPKSGTIWTQHILSLICSEGYRNGTEETTTDTRIPWLETKSPDIHVDWTKYAEISPRLFTTHLSYSLIPQELKTKKGKVIYVVRNPKDVAASFYHFYNIFVHLKKPANFDEFMERFLAGDVVAGLWFDHVQGWYSHKDEFNVLFLKYEDMIMDLCSIVQKICKFLGRELDETTLNTVVEKASFKNMKMDTRANGEHLPGQFFNENKARFMRKGTIGDWKNLMTVAQSEQFDAIFKEKMKGLPIIFTWDISEQYSYK
uniref:Sulfotransferase n=1 Tax=Leptobrachium leishanense TaxID=445787 RepID=A0A8C5QSU1_9ANUR